MLIEASDALQLWLSTAMEPICDADPTALAKYVMALLKKDKSEDELKEFCIDQLDVFLQKETKSFVERLFAVVRDKSYTIQTTTKDKSDLSSSVNVVNTQPTSDISATSSSTAISNKSHDSIVSSTDDDVAVKSKHTVRPRRRISPPQKVNDTREVRERRGDHTNYRVPVDNRSRSRSRDRRPPRRDWASGSSSRGGARAESTRHIVERRERRRSKSRSPHDRSNSSKGTQIMPKIVKEELKKSQKLRCRDFDEKGYCMRGDQCPFDHGPDPVVVDDTALEKMVNIGKNVPLPNFSVPPPGYTPLHPPPPGVDAIYVPHSGTILPSATATISTDAYNPEAPALNEPTRITEFLPHDFTIPPPRVPSSTTWPTQSYTTSTSVLIRPGLDGSFPKRDRSGIGVGLATGREIDRQMPDPNSTSNKTLEVRKIPEQMNNIAKLNEHFARFGQITNMQVQTVLYAFVNSSQVRYNGDPEAALITYAVRHQAMSAYKSTAPILNNRFIKVFWHGVSENDSNLSSLKDRLGEPINDKKPNTDEKIVVNKFGSLTKTVFNPDAANGNQQHKFVAADVSKNVVSSTQTSTRRTKENYIQIRKDRKLDKEKKMRFLDLYRRKSALLTKQLESQKILIDEMKKAALDGERKQQIYQVFKIGEQSIKRLKCEVEELVALLTTLNNQQQSNTTTTTDEKNNGEEKTASKSDVDKKILDVELELINADASNVDTRTALQQRLVQLKQQQSSQYSNTTESRSTTHPARKQRTVIPHTATLDKRPRKLVVSGFDISHKDALIEHLEQFGQMDDLYFDQRNGEQQAIIIYKQRKDAEQALSLAEDFVHCQLIVRWAQTTNKPGESGVGRSDSLSSSDIVPDEARPPSERVSAANLLASIGNTESDDSDKDDDVDLDDDAFDE